MSDAQTGPVESRQWPAELTAHAVTDDGDRRLFGYDVERDLAQHYAFSDTLLLALTGELPDDPRSRAFAAVLTFASTMSVAEAPIHASVLARICGVRTGGVLAIGTLALGEHADALLRGIGAALDSDPTELPSELRAHDVAERASVERLRSAIGAGLEVRALAADPSRDVAIVAVLRACGLTTAFQLGTALSVARLPSALAEAAKAKVGDFKGYPMEVPAFEYDPAAPPAAGRP